MRRVASRRSLFTVLLLGLALALPLSLADLQREYPPALGPQGLVIVTVQFSDLKPEYYPSIEQIEEVIRQVNDYYLEASYGQFWFEGYVTHRFYDMGAFDSYNFTGGPGGMLEPPVQLFVDAIVAADEEVDYSQYRHVLVLLAYPLEPWMVIMGWADYSWYGLSVATDDGVAVEESYLVPSVHPWTIYAWVHELGHMLGLPDDSHYQPRDVPSSRMLPDPVARGDLVHMIAWNKIALGWIPAERILEVPLGGSERVALDPIERDTEGALVVKVVKDPEHYWLVEARRPIGFDAELSPCYWGGLPELTHLSTVPPCHQLLDGVLVSRVKQPSSVTAPWWGWPGGLRIWSVDGLLEFGPGGTAIHVDEEENLLIAVVGEVGESYVVEISTAEEAIEVRQEINRTSEEAEARLVEGVSSEEAEAKLLEAVSKCELALQSYLQYDFESARNLVEDAQSLIEHASQLEEEIQSQQLYLTIASITAAAAIVAIALLWLRRRKERAVASTQ